jgi:hypothetical protein
MERTDNPDARARNFVEQPHGGAILSPLPHGSSLSSITAARQLGMRNIRKQCRRLLAEASVPNTERLLKLCLSDDERVSIIALKEYYDRFLGKAGDVGLVADEASDTLDVSHLSADQRRELHDALMVLARLSGQGGGE